MGYANEGSDDFEKLQKAFRELTGTFGSVENILDAFGLSDMPVAQQYGILFGCLVFVCTVTAVGVLLTLGGSFQRIKEQEASGQPTLLAAHEARKQRALLLEQLLASREWMLQRNYEKTTTPSSSTDDEITPLTTMLLNEAPGQAPKNDASLIDLITNTLTGGDNNKKNNNKSTTTSTNTTNELSQVRQSLPPDYELHYKQAYRRCQDQPGGPTLPGRFEARHEAYARAYAGCGSHTTTTYRRSYARLYEATACASHQTDDAFLKLFAERPRDIIGRFVRLEALQADRHAEALYKLTSGEPSMDHKSFEPNEVWGFLPEGPFANVQEMKESFVFTRRQSNQAAFAIIQNVTHKLLGMVWLSHDDPTNLSIQLETPILQPKMQGTREELEACFLLLDRLFAHGYRRIQLSLDSQDAVQRKLANRLGFTLEGVLYKHLIVKEASRDSNVYGLLNSDWKRGARNALFGKLYGKAALASDKANEAREMEMEEQEQQLAEKKQLEEEAKNAKTKAAKS